MSLHRGKRRHSTPPRRARCSTEGELDLTERQYLEAAQLFGQAADYLPAGHGLEHSRYTRRQAYALFRQGDERSDRSALLRSVGLYRNALKEFPTKAALDWAATQKDLGNSLATLGGRESGPESLLEAVSAYLASLTVYAREITPLQWAMTQVNLGNALEALGERGSKTAYPTELALMKTQSSVPGRTPTSDWTCLRSDELSPRRRRRAVR
jgi:hypothetical protein